MKKSEAFYAAMRCVVLGGMYTVDESLEILDFLRNEMSTAKAVEDYQAKKEAENA